MPKLPRVTVKQFGATGASTDFGQFGSKTAGAPQTSQDPSIIMQLARWGIGWTQAAVGAAFNPYLEDLNAFCLATFYFIANAFERGIADWDSGTTYYKGALVQDPAGNGDVYLSILDNNLNNAIPGHAGNAFWKWWNPSGSGSGLDADTVDGIHASATPVAGKLLALDGSAKFPPSVLPGAFLQNAFASGNTFQQITQDIPLDDTKPQITEGTEILTVAITPKAATSNLLVTIVIPFNAGSTNHMVAAIFRDAGADALNAWMVYSQGNLYETITLQCLVAAGSTAATTFRLRVGADSAYLCGIPGTRYFGGAAQYTMRVDEIAAP